jgi:hypothetical protein
VETGKKREKKFVGLKQALTQNASTADSNQLLIVIGFVDAFSIE